MLIVTLRLPSRMLSAFVPHFQQTAKVSPGVASAQVVDLTLERRDSDHNIAPARNSSDRTPTASPRTHNDRQHHEAPDETAVRSVTPHQQPFATRDEMVVLGAGDTIEDGSETSPGPKGISNPRTIDVPSPERESIKSATDERTCPYFSSAQQHDLAKEDSSNTTPPATPSRPRPAALGDDKTPCDKVSTMIPVDAPAPPEATNDTRDPDGDAATVTPLTTAEHAWLKGYESTDGPTAQSDSPSLRRSRDASSEQPSVGEAEAHTREMSSPQRAPAVRCLGVKQKQDSVCRCCELGIACEHVQEEHKWRSQGQHEFQRKG